MVTEIPFKIGFVMMALPGCENSIWWEVEVEKRAQNCPLDRSYFADGSTPAPCALSQDQHVAF